jgi:hypothetical protein
MNRAAQIVRAGSLNSSRLLESTGHERRLGLLHTSPTVFLDDDNTVLQILVNRSYAYVPLTQSLLQASDEAVFTSIPTTEHTPVP